MDLFLAYRAVKAWDDIIALAERLPQELARTVLVQEHLALALNRAGHREEAERILLDLIERRGEEVPWAQEVEEELAGWEP